MRDGEYNYVWRFYVSVFGLVCHPLSILLSYIYSNILRFVFETTTANNTSPLGSIYFL